MAVPWKSTHMTLTRQIICVDGSLHRRPSASQCLLLLLLYTLELSAADTSWTERLRTHTIAAYNTHGQVCGATGALSVKSRKTSQETNHHDRPHNLVLRGGGRTYLRYWRNEDGQRVYTLEKIDPNGQPTLPAHPPPIPLTDTYSRQRVTLQLRHGLIDEAVGNAEVTEKLRRMMTDPALAGQPYTLSAAQEAALRRMYQRKIEEEGAPREREFLLLPGRHETAAFGYEAALDAASEECGAGEHGMAQAEEGRVRAGVLRGEEAGPAASPGAQGSPDRTGEKEGSAGRGVGQTQRRVDGRPSTGGEGGVRERERKRRRG